MCVNVQAKAMDGVITPATPLLTNLMVVTAAKQRANQGYTRVVLAVMTANSTRFLFGF